MNASALSSSGLNPAVFGGRKVIDVDTHLTEPHDLWTKRAPARLKDRVPQVKVHQRRPLLGRRRRQGPAPRRDSLLDGEARRHALAGPGVSSITSSRKCIRLRTAPANGYR